MGARTGVAILLAGVLSVGLGISTAATASADTLQIETAVYPDWETFPWEFDSTHAGDDIGFNQVGSSHVDVRWRTCSGSAYGNIVRDVYGDGQGAVIIGSGFVAGTCLKLQFRSRAGTGTGVATGPVYYDYNIV